MKKIEKAMDTILDLYNNRTEQGHTAAGMFQLIKSFINDAKEFSLHEKAELEIFNIECLKNCK